MPLSFRLSAGNSFWFLWQFGVWASFGFSSIHFTGSESNSYEIYLSILRAYYRLQNFRKPFQSHDALKNSSALTGERDGSLLCYLTRTSYITTALCLCIKSYLSPTEVRPEKVFKLSAFQVLPENSTPTYTWLQLISLSLGWYWSAKTPPARRPTELYDKAIVWHKLEDHLWRKYTIIGIR